MKNQPRPEDGCPDGFRFVVNLIGAANIAEAREWCRSAYGQAYAEKAAYLDGAFKLSGTTNDKERKWIPTNGVRIFVPKRLSLKRRSA